MVPHEQAEAPDDIREVAAAAAAHERAAQETRSASVLALLHQKASFVFVGCWENEVVCAAALTSCADVPRPTSGAKDPLQVSAKPLGHQWQSYKSS